MEELELKEQLIRVKKDNKRFADRDGNAIIKLSIPNDVDPFHQEECNLIDFGVSDNIYIVGCSAVTKVKKGVTIDMLNEAIEESYKKGYLDRSVAGWVDVNKELPKEGVPVLALRRYKNGNVGIEPMMMSNEGEGLHWNEHIWWGDLKDSSNYDWQDKYVVTLWTYIPEPPPTTLLTER